MNYFDSILNTLIQLDNNRIVQNFFIINFQQEKLKCFKTILNNQIIFKNINLILI